MSTLRVSLVQQPLAWQVQLPRAPFAEFRDKFPAHLDADRFTLELQDPPPRP
jgi:hypothetical protein